MTRPAEAHRAGAAHLRRFSSDGGAYLALALAGWGLAAVPSAPGNVGFAASVVLGVAAYAVGHLAAGRWRTHAAVTLPALVVAAFLLTLPQSLSGSPTAPPLGYANANAALVTAAVAGLLVLPRPLHRAGQALRVLGAVALTAVAAGTGSKAGLTSCALLSLLLVLPRLSAAVSQTLSLAVVAAAGAATTWLGSTYRGTVTPWQAATLSQERIALWSDAIAMGGTHPVTGVGPGNFARFSEMARLDQDLAWAHSAPLQIFAELGAVGLGLLALLLIWLTSRLGRLAIVMAVLSLQPMIDYVLHFPWVLVSFSFVLGSLAAVRDEDRPRSGRAGMREHGGATDAG